MVLVLQFLDNPFYFNSFAPEKFGCDFKPPIVILIGIFNSSYDNALKWLPRAVTDDKSTLVQVMA